MAVQRKNLLLLFALFFLLLSGCTVGSSPYRLDEEKNTSNQRGGVNKEPVIGGELLYQALALPEWNPLKWLEATDQLNFAERLVYRGLFTYTPEGDWKGDLVDHFSLEENGEKKNLHFTLKKDAKWQDGSPVTFADVQFTLETYLNPFFYGAWKQDLSYIDGTSLFRSGKTAHIGGIRQGKDGEILIDVTSPTSSFYHALTAPLLPAKSLSGKSPEEIQELAQKGKVMGTGPFKVVSIGAEEYRFERAFSYKEGGPYLDRIVIHPSQGSGESEWAGIDLMEVPPSPDAKAPEGYKEMGIPARLYAYLGFNLQSPSLRPEVRNAISLRMDREAMVKQALFGQAVPVSSLLPPGYGGADGKAPPSPEEKKAVTAMEALGYSTDKPLTLTLAYPQAPPLMERLAEELQRELQTIHIQLNEKPMPKDHFYASLFSGEKMELFLHSWPYVEDLGLWWKMFGKEHDVENLGLNVYHYGDAEVSTLLQTIYRTAPFALSKEKAKEAAAKLEKAEFLLPLFAPVKKFWMNGALHGVKIDGNGNFLQVETWWKEK